MNQYRALRKAVVAGQFYPGDPQRLQNMLTELISASSSQPAAGKPRALIVPHAGYQFSSRIAGAAYASLRDAAAIERVVVLAPSHRVPLRGVSVSTYDAFSTPLGDIPVDTDACRELQQTSRLITDRNDAHEFEHSLEVQLPFLQAVLGEFRLIPVVCGQVTAAEQDDIARALARYLWRPDTLWVVSSDFTHYGRSFGYKPFNDNEPERVRELDHGAIDLICQDDVEGFQRYIHETGATICGATPIAILLSALQHIEEDFSIEKVSYSTSGEITGDHRETVSYASIVVTAVNEATNESESTAEFTLSEEAKRIVQRLAREAIVSGLGLADPPTPEPASLPDVLQQKACCFVTLRLESRLRGCIGSLEPHESLYQNVIRNARNAAFSDPRFGPLSDTELPKIDIEISVLTPARPIASPDEFIPGRHGIILKKGISKAVFLPQVATEQGWDRETTLTHLALKAGLGANEWRRGAEFEVFEAIVFGEDDEDAG